MINQEGKGDAMGESGRKHTTRVLARNLDIDLRLYRRAVK